MAKKKDEPVEAPAPVEASWLPPHDAAEKAADPWIPDRDK